MSWSEPSRGEVGGTAFLRSLQAQFEEQGFRFTPNPDPGDLPDFLNGYRPDAVAKRQGVNVAIEIKDEPSATAEESLGRIRRLFDGRPDWRFTVAYGGRDPLRSLAIPAASSAAIAGRVGEVERLAALGQRRAAFIMAWSLLEAALHRLDAEAGRAPRTPGTVVERLATLGVVEPALEEGLRGLIALRNRIVHGDVEAEPSASDVELVVSAVAAALVPEAA